MGKGFGWMFLPLKKKHTYEKLLNVISHQEVANYDHSEISVHTY